MKNIVFPWYLLLLVMGVAAPCFTGCARKPRDMSLVDPKPTYVSPEDPDGERRRLAEMQIVRYVDPTGTHGADLFMTTKRLGEVLTYPTDPLAACNYLKLCPGVGNSDGCYFTACVSRQTQCVARVLQNVASVRAQPLKFTRAYKFEPPVSSPDPSDLENPNNYVPITGEFEVPAQSAAARAAILREALALAKGSVEHLQTVTCSANDGQGANYVLPQPSPTDPRKPLPFPAGTTAAGLFAQTYLDAKHLIDDLTNDTVDAVVAVADSQRGSSSSLERATARAMSGVQLSRAEAAHLLLGGEPGLVGQVSRALCSSPELSGRAQRALAVIRRVAPDPEVVTNSSISIETFLNGSAVELATGSVAYRLSYLDGKAISGATGVEDYTGLSEDDFVQARSYLSQEIQAFSRSRAAFTRFSPKALGAPLPGGHQVYFYRGTNTEPTPPPPEYYAALSRYRNSWALPSALADREATYAVSKIFGGGMTLRNGLANQLNATAKSQFLGAMDPLLSHDPRIAELRLDINAMLSVRFSVHGRFTTSDDLRVVNGLDGLLCATTGYVEGVPCTATDLTSTEMTRTALNIEFTGLDSNGITRGVRGAFGSLPTSPIPRFVVAKRSRDLPTQPGNYYVLTGIVRPSSGNPNGYSHAIIPDLERKAGELLTPSRAWCAHPAVECDGTAFDERLPLENELADDQDGVESSWKHYLALADQAATEADALGQQYLQDGIEVDRQTESTQLREAEDEIRFRSRLEVELENIQRICGTAVGTTELAMFIGASMGLLQSNSGKTCNIGTANDCCGGVTPCPYVCSGTPTASCQPSACDEDSDCCSSGQCGAYECVAARCARTIPAFFSDFNLMDQPPQSEANARLKACLGDESITDYAVLGDKPVCLWEKSDAPSAICYGTTNEFPCPVIANEPTVGTFNCNGISSPPGATAPHLVSTTLGLFDSTAALPPIDPCNALRRLRDWTASSGTAADRVRLCEHVQDSTLVYPPLFGEREAERAANISGGMEYDPTHGGRVTIKLDGAPVWSTIPGVGSGWPCSAYPGSNSSAFPHALTSATVDCAPTTVDEWKAVASMNERLMKALVVLKGLTRGDFDSISVPAFLSGLGFHLRRGDSWSSTTPRDEDTSSGLYRVTFRNGSSFGVPGELAVFDDSTPSAPEFWRNVKWAPQTWTPVAFQAPHNGGNYPETLFITRFPKADAEWDSSFIRTVLGIGKFCGRSTTDYVAGNLQNRPLPVGDPYDFVTYSLTTDYPYPAQDDWEVAIDAGALPDFPYLTYRTFYNESALADAAELLCETSRGTHRSATPTAPCQHELDLSQLKNAADFGAVQATTHCRLSEFQKKISTLVLPRVPTQVLDSIATFKVDGTFPTYGGELGGAISSLAGTLTSYGGVAATMRDLSAQFSDEVDNMATAMSMIQVRTQEDVIREGIVKLEANQAVLRLEALEFQEQARWIQQGLGCITAIHDPVNGATACAAGAVTGVLESASLSYERRLADIELQIAEGHIDLAELNSEVNRLEGARALRDARGRLRTLVSQMAAVVRDAQSALDGEIRTKLIGIEGLRLAVSRAITRAVTFESSQAQVTERIESVLDAKLNVSKQRYLTARKNAVRLAMLAKRAIEQRLGVHLSSLRTDLPLVEAPASWEADVCTAEGIDYELLRSDEASEELKNFAGAFVGDYVDKLRSVVESYRLEYDFHEGSDEVIASLRDDVLGVKAECLRPSPNLLRYSAEMDMRSDGWEVMGCPVSLEGGTYVTGCLGKVRIADKPILPTYDSPAAGAFRLVWGNAANVDTVLAQKVALAPGRYRVSWYSLMASSMPETEVNLLGVNGLLPRATANDVDRWTLPWLPATPPPPSWPRHFRIFDVEAAQNGAVAIYPGEFSGGTGTVAGVMLEKLGESAQTDSPQFLPPAVFAPTGGDLVTSRPVCEDTDGVVFRQTGWRHDCSALCSNGFSDNCSGAVLTRRCYWEKAFSLDIHDLESGLVMPYAGFARGNFNYRIEEIAVNFVGADARNCSGSDAPSACYAQGFIPYSLKHMGPLRVRNHTGDDFAASLFDGNIEYARGLSLERYLTNPLGNTDRELLAPYVRGEYRGRPLDGNFILRVWEEEGLDFEAIGDIQLYMKYRYWTRNN